MSSSPQSIRFSRMGSMTSKKNLVRNMSQSKYKSTRKAVEAPTSKLWIAEKNSEWTLWDVVTEENSALIVKDESGKVKVIDKTFCDTFPYNKDVKADMASLNYLNEPCILHNLRERYVNAHHYMYMGMVLIAVNPFQYYDLPAYEEYVNKPLNPETPHPYAIAGNKIHMYHYIFNYRTYYYPFYVTLFVSSRTRIPATLSEEFCGPVNHHLRGKWSWKNRNCQISYELFGRQRRCVFCRSEPACGSHFS